MSLTLLPSSWSWARDGIGAASAVPAPVDFYTLYHVQFDGNKPRNNCSMVFLIKIWNEIFVVKQNSVIDLETRPTLSMDAVVYILPDFCLHNIEIYLQVCNNPRPPPPPSHMVQL